MSSSSIRIISSSSTTRIRLAGVADCNCVADVILYPPMDTPVESTDHAPLRNRRVERCARGISPLKAHSPGPGIPLARKQWFSQGQSRPAAGTTPAGRQGEVEALLVKTDGTRRQAEAA